MKVERQVSIPRELVKDVETIDFVIKSLKLHKKMLQNKTITSKKGIVNKIRFYFRGYVLVTNDYVEGMLEL